MMDADDHLLNISIGGMGVKNDAISPLHYHQALPSSIRHQECPLATSDWLLRLEIY
jgi:hypothetical protein